MLPSPSQSSLLFSDPYLPLLDLLLTDGLCIKAFVEGWHGGEGHPFHWTFHGYPMDKNAA